jgi:hypothetical protein
MIIGSMVTIACACICAVGEDDKPKTLVVRDGDIIYEFIESTGKVINIYYLKELTENGELYERRATK